MQDTKAIYKNWLHFYTLINELSKIKREVKKIIPFTTTSIRIKFLGIKFLGMYLTELVKDLYIENSKILMKKK